ncbi:zinc ribbon domain-containing protein [uncultured Methanobrevibacter sp.]|uniref:zinc ribbon domain-containing protein n=1 Tax=uncultured Methanobrevibacter sp. TaxID=253161 RepID=UPI0025CC078B|nr:zinc ribbon domain-containing protein [uncultured Methanobrevibacter sp.]
MTFCPSCGAEKKEGSKFCHNCGYDFEAAGAGGNTEFNSNPQVNQNPIPNVQPEKTYTIAKVLGYLCAILIPLFGIIFGVYLYTRPEDDAKKHGKLMIGLALVIWAISFLVLSR